MRFLALLSGMFLFCLHVQASSIDLTEQNSDHSQFQLAIFEDSSAQLSADEVIKRNEWQVSDNKISKGYTPSTYWLKIEVNNPQTISQQRYLYFSESFLKDVSLYVKVGGSWQVFENGAATPLESRQEQYLFPTFNLEFKPEQQTTLLLKLRSDFGLFGQVGLYKQQTFFQNYLTINTIHIFMFGAILAIALFNLGLWRTLRDKIYLYYVGYAVSYMGWLLLFTGFYFTLLPTSLFVAFNSVLPIAFVFLILFSQALLNVKREFPRLNLWLNVLLVAFLLCALLIPFIPRIGFEAANTLGVFLMPSLFVLGVLAIKHKLVNAKVYTLALFAYFVGMALLGLLALGILPYSTVLRCAPFPGTLLELILFSLALANRINRHKQEVLEAQQRLVLVKEKANQELEYLVTQRTEEINNQKKQLELLSITDGLTNLYNRRSFRDSFEALSKSIPAEQVLVLAMVDIDHFKSFNDTYGHQKGDEALIAVADAIGLKALQLGGKAFRIGGEEFALLFFSNNEQQAIEEIENCREQIQALKIAHQQSSLGVLTASFGIVVDNGAEQISLANLYKCADSALYEVKALGRNKVKLFTFNDQ